MGTSTSQHKGVGNSKDALQRVVVGGGHTHASQLRCCSTSGIGSSKQSVSTGSKSQQSSIRFEDLQPGDVLLTATPAVSVASQLGRAVAAPVVRQVVATQKGGYFAQTIQNVHAWNGVAVIAATRDGTLCALTGSVIGLEVYPLRERLLYLHSIGAKVAVRQLSLHSRASQSRVREVTDRLLNVALSGCVWADLSLPSPLATNSGDALARAAHPSDGDGRRPSGGHTNEDAKDSGQGGAEADTGTGLEGAQHANAEAAAVARDLLPRVRDSVAQMPPQVRMELVRTFNRFDLNRDGEVDVQEVRAVLRDLRGSYVSKREAKSFMLSLDKNSDGVLTFQEFAAGIAKRPMDHVPVEHDLEGIVAAEFVALALRWMGMLPTRRPAKRPLPSIQQPQAATTMSAGGGDAAVVRAGGAVGFVSELHGTTIQFFTPHAFSSLQRMPQLLLASASLDAERVIELGVLPGEIS